MFTRVTETEYPFIFKFEYPDAEVVEYGFELTVGGVKIKNELDTTFDSPIEAIVGLYLALDKAGKSLPLNRLPSIKLDKDLKISEEKTKPEKVVSYIPREGIFGLGIKTYDPKHDTSHKYAQFEYRDEKNKIVKSSFHVPYSELFRALFVIISNSSI